MSSTSERLTARRDRSKKIGELVGELYQLLDCECWLDTVANSPDEGSVRVCLHMPGWQSTNDVEVPTCARGRVLEATIDAISERRASLEARNARH